MTLTRKEILMAFANDEVVQVSVDGVWQDCNIYRYLDLINGREYRIKPKTITINGVECTAPPEEARGTLDHVTVHVGRIGEHPSELIRFLFNTEADARQVFDALIKPFQGEQQ